MTMSQADMANKVHALGSAWESFKRVNDQRLNELERKGSSDPLHDEQLSRINHVLDNTQHQIKSLEASMYRPAAGDDRLVKNSAAAEEHKGAFCSYLRKGVDAGLVDLEQKALSVGSDPDGGYLVTSAMSQTIAKAIKEVSPVRALARVEMVSTDALEIVQDHEDFGAGWTSETASVSDTTTPQFGRVTIPVHELFAQPKATQKLIDDSAVDIEMWLSEKISEIFSSLENASFVSGDGVGKPRGFLTYNAGTDWGEIEQIDSGSNGAVTADALIELYYSLKEQYAAKASFLMHRSVLQAVRQLKTGATGEYLWAPGLNTGQPDTLLGVPVYTATDMPTATTGSLSVALGDFHAGYQVVDRLGVRVLRDPFTDKPFVKFYATKRVGGDVVNFDAIKLMKLAQ